MIQNHWDLKICVVLTQIMLKSAVTWLLSASVHLQTDTISCMTFMWSLKGTQKNHPWEGTWHCILQLIVHRVFIYDHLHSVTYSLAIKALFSSLHFVVSLSALSTVYLAWVVLIAFTEADSPWLGLAVSLNDLLWLIDTWRKSQTCLEFLSLHAHPLRSSNSILKKGWWIKNSIGLMIRWALIVQVNNVTWESELLVCPKQIFSACVFWFLCFPFSLFLETDKSVSKSALEKILATRESQRGEYLLSFYDIHLSVHNTSVLLKLQQITVILVHWCRNKCV